MNGLNRPKWMALFGFSLVIALASISVPHCFAQAIASAQISGTVSDPSGAAVPNAQVVATQTNTGLVRNAETNTAGTYILPNLPIGPYSVAVTKEGFTAYLQNGILLQVSNNVTINVTLQVGAVTQQVRVVANATMVQTEDTSVSQVIDQRRMVDLPLNGRQSTQLILLSGAAAVTPGGDLTSSKTYPTSTTISVAGGQANGTNYLMDGADNNESFTNVNLPFPFPDALQEFSVQTNGLSARFGSHPGAAVNLVTKSGSNHLHGDVFDFLRNGDLNARNFFASRQDTLKRNQFGGTAGGPIIQDKLFFFGGYQGTRNRQAPPTSTSFVPTPAALLGDFSTLESGTCQSGGLPRSIVDPLTGVTFPSDFVDPSRFNAQALALMKYIPTSSNPCGKLIIAIPTTGDEDQGIARVDWIESSRNTIFGRYFITDYRDPPIFNGTNLLTTTKPGILDRGQAAVLGDTFAFNPTSINSAHISWTRMRVNRSPAPNVPNPQTLGINIYTAVPNFIYTVVNNYFTVGCTKCTRGVFNSNSVQFEDDVDLVRGRHHISLGAQLIHNQLNSLSNASTNGRFTFNGSATNDALLDFLLGSLGSFSQEDPEVWQARGNDIGVYTQDDIRVNRRLTAHVGLRWEPYLPAADIFDRGTRFDLAGFLSGATSSRFVNAPPGLLYTGDPGVPKGVSYSHLGDFEPRVGLAWDPKGDGHNTIRASYSIFYDEPMMYFPQNMSLNSPFGNFLTLVSPTGGFTNPYLGYPGGNPFPHPIPAPKTASFPQQGTYGVMPAQIHPTYAQEWELSYQHQFATNWIVSVTYAGNKTTHVWDSTQLNPAAFIPGTCNGSPCSTTGNTNQRRLLYLLNPVAGGYYGPMSGLDDGANSEYNALMVVAEHRFSHEFTSLATYAFSHCISEGDFGAGELEGSSYQNPYNRNADRGNCNYDHRHIFNLSLVATTPKFSQAWEQRLLGDWQFSSIVSARSGDFSTVTTGGDTSLTDMLDPGGSFLDRPNLVGNPYPATQTIQDWVVRSAFQANQPGTYGNAARDSIIGPGFLDFDIGLSRFFHIREGKQLEFRFEGFNIFNHPNFNDPVVDLSSSSFGRILSAQDPRILQFALKFQF